jgi:hypothetical protein
MGVTNNGQSRLTRLEHILQAFETDRLAELRWRYRNRNATTAETQELNQLERQQDPELFERIDQCRERAPLVPVPGPPGSDLVDFETWLR